VSAYEMVWTRWVQGDEGEVDLEGTEGRADAFATSTRVGRALLEKKLTWLRSWRRPENKLAARRPAWLMALHVLDLKLRVAKLRLTGYDLRTTTQRSR